MSEDIKKLGRDDDDAEGHRQPLPKAAGDDDTEGHRCRAAAAEGTTREGRRRRLEGHRQPLPKAAGDDEDVEGHRQPLPKAAATTTSRATSARSHTGAQRSPR